MISSNSARGFLYSIFSCVAAWLLLAGVTGLGPLSAQAQSLVSVTLAWDPSADEDVVNYRLYVGGTLGIYTNVIACGTNLVGTVPGLVVGSTYYFVVRAVDSTGLESEPSNEVAYLVEAPEYVFDAGLVTRVEPGSLRSDFGGFVGMTVRIGEKPLLVSSLGRFAVEGNRAAHLLKIVRSDGSQLPGASTTVNMAGSSPGTFVYAPLQQPTLLQALNTYYVLSQEEDRGDAWHDIDTITLTTPDATITEGAWAHLSGGLNVHGSADLAYGPLDFVYEVVTNVVTPGGAILAHTPGKPRNDFTGWVGAKLQANAGSLLVTSLGRFMVPGNSGSHEVRLVNAATGLAVPGGEVTVNLAGQTPGGYIYQTLPTPVVLNAGATYYLLSKEQAGGDVWHDIDTTVTAADSVKILSGAWGYGDGTWYEAATANHSYGPVSLDVTNVPASTNKSDTPDTGFVRDFTAGKTRTDYDGYVGMRVVVGDAPLLVTDLGRLTLPGNSGTHHVKLVRASDGVDVPGGEATVSMLDGAPGSFQFVRLPSAVKLDAKAAYYVVSWESAGGDTWYDGDITLTTTADAAITSAAWEDYQGNWYAQGSAGNSFGPANFKYALAPIETNQGPGQLIVGQSLGTVRNDFEGWVGVTIRVGATPLQVQSLGRIVAPGNSGVHALKLVKASDGSDVAGSLCSVNMADARPGDTYVYTALPQPVTLQPGTDYYLLSLENQGGDSWYDVDSTVTSSAAATIVNGAWGFRAGEWYEHGASQNAFGPVNLKYTTQSETAQTGLVVETTPGSLRNDFSGYVGLRFKVGASPLTITELGRFVVAGNAGSHLVKLVTASDGADVAGGSVAVTTSGATAAQYCYAPLAAPVTLRADTEYLLVTLETQGGDQWHDWDTMVTGSSAATILSAAWGPLSGGWYYSGTAGQAFGPVDFKYVPTAGGTSRLISTHAPGKVRNEFTGWVGVKLQVGSRAMIVKSLGRLKLPGNTGTHTLRILSASDGTPVPGAVIAVTTAAGAAGEFVYGQLAEPVTLPAGGSYYLLCSEVAGADTWFDIDTTVVTTGDAAVLSGAWSHPSGQVFVNGSSGSAYGPLSLEYELAD